VSSKDNFIYANVDSPWSVFICGSKEAGSPRQSHVSWRMGKLLLLLEDVTFFSICSRFLLLNCLPLSLMILISDFGPAPLVTARLFAESSRRSCLPLRQLYKPFECTAMRSCLSMLVRHSHSRLRVSVKPQDHEETLRKPPWTAQRWS
jgi:hypothetical protein